MLKKTIIMLIIAGSIVLPATITSAITKEENYFADKIQHSDEFKEKVSQEDHYYKVIDNNNSNIENNQSDIKLDENYNLKEVSRLEYDLNADNQNNFLISTLSAFEPNVGTTNNKSASDGYLHISTEVFRSNYTKERFQATTFFNWTQFPAVHFTDTVGVFVSEGMHIDTEYYDTKSEVAFYHWDGKTDVFDNEIKHDPHSRGEAARVKISRANAYHKNFAGYITAYPKFSQTTSNNQSGTVSGVYQHYAISLGDFSFDVSGKPSVGLSKNASEVIAPVSVNTVYNMS